MDPKFDEHPELATSFVLRTGCDFDPAHHPLGSPWRRTGLPLEEAQMLQLISTQSTRKDERQMEGISSGLERKKTPFYGLENTWSLGHGFTLSFCVRY